MFNLNATQLDLLEHINVHIQYFGPWLYGIY